MFIYTQVIIMKRSVTTLFALSFTNNSFKIHPLLFPFKLQSKREYLKSNLDKSLYNWMRERAEKSKEQKNYCRLN